MELLDAIMFWVSILVVVMEMAVAVILLVWIMWGALESLRVSYWLGRLWGWLGR